MKKKNIYAKAAKERRNLGTNLDQNSDQGRTLQKLAKEAKTSHDTIHKVEKILEKAAPELIAKVREGDISINKAYNDIKKLQVLP